MGWEGHGRRREGGRVNGREGKEADPTFLVYHATPLIAATIKRKSNTYLIGPYEKKLTIARPRAVLEPNTIKQAVQFVRG